jgi:uncharacterized protein (DUF1501 family)
MKESSRRDFLRHMGALGAMGGTGAWMADMASAQSTGTDYRALVCIYLAGGNDAHNTVVATDTQSWRCYSAMRDPVVMAKLTGTTPPSTMVSLALDPASLLKITPTNAKGLNTGRTFALNPQLKRIQALFSSGKAAIVANVGPLVMPVSKADFQELHETPVPRGLFSHNDQTSTWQSFGPDGSTGGWGGKLMDKLASRNGNASFSAIGVNANAVWLSGTTVIPYMMGTSGFFVMGGSAGQVFGSTAIYSAMRQAATTTSRTDDIALDYGRVAQRTLSAETALSLGLPANNVSPWGTPGAASNATDPLLQYTEPSDGKTYLNPLAQQLQVVARTIAARGNSQIGAKRQVFMVQLPGFDTHGNQLLAHATLMAKLDHAVGYFQTCLAGMPGGDLSSQVTTFTASEFGRKLVNNGAGTDHGWGGHHFVIGGAVKGGEMYGRFPDFLAFDGQGGFFSNDLIDGGGGLLPEISVDQVVYTLGKWMGVAQADLAGATPGTGIAPNIQNFDPTLWDLGFMSA